MKMAANTWIFLGTAEKNTAYDLSNITYKELFLVPIYNNKDCTGIHITPLCETYNIYNGYTTQTPRCIQIICNNSQSKVNIRYSFNEASSPTLYINGMTMDIYYR